MKIDKNFELGIHVDGDDIEVMVYDPESGNFSRIRTTYCPYWRPEFSEDIGNEIYSWVSLWIDEQ